MKCKTPYPFRSVPVQFQDSNGEDSTKVTFIATKTSPTLSTPFLLLKERHRFKSQMRCLIARHVGGHALGRRLCNVTLDDLLAAIEAASWLASSTGESRDPLYFVLQTVAAAAGCAERQPGRTSNFAKSEATLPQVHLRKGHELWCGGLSGSQE